MNKNKQLKKEFDEWLGVFPTQGVNQIADWWLAKLEEATKEAKEAEKKRIIDKYGYFNDGCGCCSRNNLGNELEQPQDEITK